jgi:hypothetical protein
MGLTKMSKNSKNSRNPPEPIGTVQNIVGGSYVVVVVVVGVVWGFYAKPSRL